MMSMLYLGRTMYPFTDVNTYRVIALERLNNYAGPVLRLHKPSTLEERDFGYRGNGIDKAEIATWAQGETVLIRTAYDASGNGFHLENPSLKPIQYDPSGPFGRINCNANRFDGSGDLFKGIQSRFLLDAQHAGHTGNIFNATISGNEGLYHSTTKFMINNRALGSAWYNCPAEDGQPLMNFLSLDSGTTGTHVEINVAFEYRPSVEAIAEVNMVNLDTGQAYSETRRTTGVGGVLPSAVDFEYHYQEIGGVFSFTKLVIW